MTKFGKKFLTTTAALALVAQTALAVGPAHAVDLLGEPTEEYTEVEFGTGWYIRGDIGINFYQDVATVESAATVPGFPSPVIVETERDDFLNFGVGVGYRVSPNFRVDANIQNFSQGSGEVRSTVSPAGLAPCDSGFVRVTNFDINGNPIITVEQRFDGSTDITNCQASASTSYDVWGGMLNAYYDIDTGLGITPFVGGGVGVLRNSFTASFGDVTCSPQAEFRCNPTDGGVPDFGEEYTQQGPRNNGVAYHAAASVLAGLSFQISKDLSFDATYAYTHMFEDPLFGGSNGVQDSGVPTDYHAFKLGLRWEIF